MFLIPVLGLLLGPTLAGSLMHNPGVVDTDMACDPDVRIVGSPAIAESEVVGLAQAFLRDVAWPSGLCSVRVEFVPTVEGGHLRGKANKTLSAVWVRETMPADQQRLTLIHELAHLAMWQPKDFHGAEWCRAYLQGVATFAPEHFGDQVRQAESRYGCDCPDCGPSGTSGTAGEASRPDPLPTR